jgi:hypothetical protein
MSSLVIAGVSALSIRHTIRTACRCMSNDGKFLIQKMFNWWPILMSKHQPSLSNIAVNIDGKMIHGREEFVLSDAKEETLQTCFSRGISSLASKVSKLFYEIEIVELSLNSSLSFGWSSEHADKSQLMWYADGIQQRSKFPLFNRAGCLMKPGRDSQLLYCSRKIGIESVEHCGPNSGPQCPDCKACITQKQYQLLKWKQGDVIGIFADLENQKLYVSVNGSAIDGSALFCDGLNAPNLSMSLVPSIVGKSAKIRINFGTSAFQFPHVDFVPFSWTAGPHALLQTFTKLFSDLFVEELVSVLILDWTPSPSLVEVILRIIRVSQIDALLTKHIRRSLLLDIDRWKNDESIVSCGTSLFRSMLESQDNFQHLIFHIYRRTSFKLLQKQYSKQFSEVISDTRFQFEIFFGIVESSIVSVKKVVSAPRTDVESKIIANVIFCLVNSLNLDPAQVELRSGYS